MEHEMITNHILTKANPLPNVAPQEPISRNSNTIPEDPAHVVNNVFSFIVLADKQKGVLCTDTTCSKVFHISLLSMIMVSIIVLQNKPQTW
jgi:hypothetical protein